MESEMLKRISLLTAAGAFVALLATPVLAVTPAPLSAPSDVINVADRCGPGFHRGPGGICRPNRPVVCRWVMTRYGRRRVCR
jgi:hypothetical protein